MARLTDRTLLVDPDGQRRVLEAGVEIPAWAEDLVGEHLRDDTPGATPAVEPAVLEEPPRSGKGSGRDAWADFAAANGIDVADDANREDIVSALAEAGIVEPDPED